jgi:hypothetical protein
MFDHNSTTIIPQFTLGVKLKCGRQTDRANRPDQNAFFARAGFTETVKAEVRSVRAQSGCKFRAALGEALAPPKALTACGPRGQRLHIRYA